MALTATLYKFSAFHADSHRSPCAHVQAVNLMTDAASLNLKCSYTIKSNFLSPLSLTFLEICKFVCTFTICVLHSECIAANYCGIASYKLKQNPLE